MLRQKKVCTDVHTRIIQDTQKIERTYISISKWIDKQSVVCTYNEYLYLHKLRSNDTWHNMDVVWKGYAVWKKLLTKGSIYYDSIYRNCSE
jgi:hypothetical protein